MEEELFEHFRLEVDKGQTPMRIDKYMASHLEDTSRSRIQQALKEGYVHIGDEVVKSNYVVRPGDTLFYISRRTGVPIRTLVGINRIKDPDLIYAGEHLKLSAQKSPF